MDVAYNWSERMAKRPSAPHLGAEHVWGVRDDWGEKAGEWGRGTKAFNKPSSKDPGKHS